MNDDKKEFPIMKCSTVTSIPWAMIEPHKVQALRNHTQSLKVLAERGGLTASEAVAVLTGMRWGTVTISYETDALLRKMKDEWLLKEGASDLLTALAVYESAFEQIFCQACSNPIKDSWGRDIDCTLLNKAHELGAPALKKAMGLKS